MSGKTQDINPIKREKSIHGDLKRFFNFESMLSVYFIKVIYFAGVIGSIIFGFKEAMSSHSVITGMVVILGANFVWRIVCEYLILFFSMHETLVSINDKLDRNPQDIIQFQEKIACTASVDVYPNDGVNTSEPNDELFIKAGLLIIESGNTTVSFLQSNLQIGYVCASRLFDLLEEKGVVGEYKGGTIPRDILLTISQFEQKFCL